MSAWAGIESEAEPRSDASGSGRTGQGVADVQARGPLAVRWRRHAKPVLGSFDTAGVIVQRHFRPLAIGAAVVLVPSVVLNLVVATMAFDRYADVSDSVISVPELFGGGPASTGIEQLLVVVGAVTASLAACLAGAFVAPLVVRRQGGSSVSARHGFRSLVGRGPALVVAWAVGHSWMVLALLVANAVADGARWPIAIVLAPVLLWIVSVTLVVSPVIVLERVGPMAALRRSWQLARRSPGVAFGFTALAVPIGIFLQYGPAALPRLIEAIGLANFGRFGWLIEGAGGQLGRLISVPVLAVATTLCYLEMRMQAEGMDLMADAAIAFPASSPRETG